MTVAPLPEPESDSVHLLTIAEYAALGETEHGYTELVEGRVIVSPSPIMDHNNAAFELAIALRSASPAAYEVQLELDVDLGLVPSKEPGSSRRPDVVVVERTARKRVRAEGGGMLRASEVLLVAEVVSPSSKRIDHRHKRDDYADAGIPNYWILDIDDPISLTACRLTDDFGYVDDQVATGTFTTDVPFPVKVSLDRLV